jgi:hypothetical protein
MENPNNVWGFFRVFFEKWLKTDRFWMRNSFVFAGCSRKLFVFRGANWRA